MQTQAIEITNHHQPSASSEPAENALDPQQLLTIADLAEARGDVRFTPGGGILFDTPMKKTERATLPAAKPEHIRYLDIPAERFEKALKRNPGLKHKVERFTVAHPQAGYRLVVVPLQGRLNPDQLRAIADAAVTYGHGSIRLTADVSIRFPNVPTALLRPLFRTLEQVGLYQLENSRLAA